MRQRNKHLARNAIQNVIILLLIISAVFLIFCTGLVRTDSIDQMLLNVTPSTGTQSNTTQSAALPVRVAVRSSGQCHVWTNETTGGDLFEDLGPVLIEALGSAKDGAPVDASEFHRALENDCIYYDFTVSLPLHILSKWIGSTETSFQSNARAFVLSGLQSNTLSLYSWDSSSDTYYCWSTSVPVESMLTNTDKYIGSAGEFAFLCSEPYNTLMPYTFIVSDRMSLSDLSTTTPGDESVKNDIMTALEFNIHSSNSYYTESNGTEVVSQGSRTLRFSPDGTVVYNGSDEDIALLRITQSDDPPSLAECAGAALDIVNTLLANRIGDAALYLSSASGDRHGNATITFDYIVNGYPIVFPGKHAVEITVENGMITHISMQLRTYTLLDTTTTLMPTLQATAALQTDTLSELFPGYYDDGSDALSPCWLYQ